MNPARLAHRHGRAVLLVSALLALAGAVSLVSLPSDIYPPLQFPRIVVIAHSGTAPARSMMLTVTRPLEQALMEVPGIRRVRSRTFRGAAEISGQFAPSTEMVVALQQAQGRIEEVRPSLPGEIDLTVERLTPAAFPILSLNLTGGLPVADLRDYAFYVMRPEIARVAGVGRVEVQASDTREIEVVADPAKLLTAGLTVQDVSAALRDANRLAPVGRFAAGGRQHLVLVSGLWNSAAQIAETPVATRAGATLRVGDVATVFPGAPDRTTLVTGNGKDAASINVSQQIGANILEVRDGVDRALHEIAGDLPSGLLLSKVYDLAEFVAAAIKSVRDAILIGAFLAIVVLMVFLRDWRVTLIAALTLPLTVLATFFFMRLFGEPINVMSMGGLAVAIGLVIDDAVVVVENIHRRTSAGVEPTRAVEEATAELVAPVVGSTLTTVVVLAPLGVLSGVVGQFFRALSITLSISVLVSLGLSLTLIPMLARAAYMRKSRRWARHGALRGEGGIPTGGVSPPIVEDRGLTDGERGPTDGSRAPIDGGRAPSAAGGGPTGEKRGSPGEGSSSAREEGRRAEMGEPPAHGEPRGALESAYARSLAAVMGRPRLAIALAVGVGLLAGLLYFRVPSGFLPEMDEGGFVIDYLSPAGTALPETDRMVRRVEATVAATPEVAAFSRRTGSEMGMFATQQNKGDVLVRLKPRTQRRRSANEIIDDLRPKLHEAAPGLEIEFVQILQDMIGDLEGAPTPIEVKIFGDDPETLEKTAAEVTPLLAAVHGVVDLVGPQRGNPEVSWEVDPVAAGRAGLTVDQVSGQLSAAWLGETATDLRLLDRTIPVRVRYPDADRFDPDRLGRTTVRGADGKPVALGSLARPTESNGQSVLSRENLRQMALITARLEARDLGGAVAEIRSRLRQAKLPVGYTIEVGGQYESQRQAFAELLMVLGIAASLVFTILVVEFRAFTPSIILLAAAPLSFGGAFLLLWITGTELNVSSAMGLILLVGLVVKNGIVMIDYAHRLHHEGAPLTEAVADAARVRLRPILMTTLCTLFGLFPLALGLGSGAELQKPLALAVIGGLGFSTLVTLYGVPSVYVALRGRLRS